VFKIISWNLIQKRTEYINIQKEKQNKHNIQDFVATIKLIKETQSIGLHNMHKGLQSISGRFQTRSAFCKFSAVIESFTAKEEDGLTPFLILDVLEAKIFRFAYS